MEKYNVINIKNLKLPITCWLDFYIKTGILSMLQTKAKELNIGPQDYILPNFVLTNQKTYDIINMMIHESWEYYSVDRDSGVLVDGNDGSRLEVKTELRDEDIANLDGDAGYWGASIDNKIPDNEIWVNLNIVKWNL